MTTTTQVIKSMLTENTGIHMMDSGGSSGRMWQRNQGVDFNAQPKYRAEFSIYPKDRTLQIDASISLYHWMNDNLRYSADLQAQFDAWVEEQNEYTPWLVLMEEFAEEFSAGKPTVVNTYNEQTDLSQAVQYVEFCACDPHEITHVILQVHGGCDARGGYTAPKCFAVKGDYYDLCSSWSLDTIEAGDFSWYWCSPGFGGDSDEIWDAQARALRHAAPTNPLALPAFTATEEIPPDLNWWVIVTPEGKATLCGKDLPQGEALNATCSCGG